VTLNADGSFSYTPEAAYNGPDSFTYKANDGTVDSNVASVSITVAPVNDVPVAAADNYTGTEDTAMNIPAPGVLANDSDVDGGGSWDNDLEVSLLTAVVATGPGHGTLVLNPDGSFTYTPQANYNGPDSFTYRANDGTENSELATVSISIDAVNDQPLGVQDSANVIEDRFVFIDVLANDSDVEDGRPTIASLSGTKSALGASIDMIGGQIRYTADADSFDLAGFRGVTDTFTYTAVDSGGLSTEVSVNVVVAPGSDGRVVNGTSRSDRFTDTSGFDTTYFGRDGKDIAFGRDGSDIMHGQDGDDRLSGDAGIDFLYGGDDEDKLDGGEGDDKLYGGDDEDQLLGAAGNDQLYGDKDDDRLDGGIGDDLLAGGRGNDRHQGGAGSDTFLFERNMGRDIVVDYNPSEDHLQLDGLTVRRITTSNVDRQGSLDTVVTFNEGGSLTLLNVTGITAADFDLLA
jgi:VCBS repeat-containing protein